MAQWRKSACQCRRHWFRLWSGKIHMLGEQGTLRATATESREPRLPGLRSGPGAAAAGSLPDLAPVLSSRRRPLVGKPAPQRGGGACSVQLERKRAWAT